MNKRLHDQTSRVHRPLRHCRLATSSAELKLKGQMLVGYKLQCKCTIEKADKASHSIPNSMNTCVQLKLVSWQHRMVIEFKLTGKNFFEKHIKMFFSREIKKKKYKFKLPSCVDKEAFDIYEKYPDKEEELAYHWL